MEKTSPREVLLKHGKWITAKDFAKLVAEKKNVSERQAKTCISKAYHNKEIKKHIFPDRTVIYGFTEFGPPTSRFTEEMSSSNERMSSWDSLKKALAEIGADLIDIEVEKRRSDETFAKITVQGIMMLAGAKTMQAAAGIYVPDEYEAFLLTQASVNERDKLTWQGINYWVWKVEEICDAYVVSYRIAKLAKPPLRIEPAWFFG